jgi:hypothetical protein
LRGEETAVARAKPKKNAIPDEVKAWAEAVIERFNKAEIGDPDAYYRARYRGTHLYLDRSNFGAPTPVCRLTYTGDPNDWEFAIYKYSTERYDPAEWCFPGAECVDGTLEGALRAGLLAYP